MGPRTVEGRKEVACLCVHDSMTAGKTQAPARSGKSPFFGREAGKKRKKALDLRPTLWYNLFHLPTDGLLLLRENARIHAADVHAGQGGMAPPHGVQQYKGGAAIWLQMQE